VRIYLGDIEKIDVVRIEQRSRSSKLVILKIVHLDGTATEKNAVVSINPPASHGSLHAVECDTGKYFTMFLDKIRRIYRRKK